MRVNRNTELPYQLSVVTAIARLYDKMNTYIQYVHDHYLQESRKILVEAASLLLHEPPELPEGRLRQQARVNLAHMDELIRNLSAALPSPL